MEGSEITHTIDLSEFSSTGTLLKRMEILFGGTTCKSCPLTLVYQVRRTCKGVFSCSGAGQMSFACRINAAVRFYFQDAHDDWMLLQSGDPWPLLLGASKRFLVTPLPVLLRPSSQPETGFCHSALDGKLCA